MVHQTHRPKEVWGAREKRDVTIFLAFAMWLGLSVLGYATLYEGLQGTFIWQLVFLAAFVVLTLFRVAFLRKGESLDD